MKTKKTLGCLLVAVLAAGPLVAGVVYEIEVTDHDASPPRTEDSQIAAEGRNLKMGIAAGEHGERGEAIYRGDRREMVIVDHGDRSYVVMDEEAIANLAGQVGGMMAQVEEMLKNVPKEQQDAVREAMKQRMPSQGPVRPQREARRTGEKGERAGYPCVKFEVLVDGAVTQELWVTDWGNVEGSDEMRELFEEIAEFFREMMEAFSEAAGGLGGIGAGLEDSMFELFDEIDGFPVVTRDFEGGELDSEATLRSARRRTLDPSEFEPPAGYKRRTMGPQ